MFKWEFSDPLAYPLDLKESNWVSYVNILHTTKMFNGETMASVNIFMFVRGCPEMTSLFYGGTGVSQKVTKSDRGEGGCQPYLVRPK